MKKIQEQLENFLSINNKLNKQEKDELTSKLDKTILFMLNSHKYKTSNTSNSLSNTTKDKKNSNKHYITENMYDSKTKEKNNKFFTQKYNEQSLIKNQQKIIPSNNQINKNIPMTHHISNFNHNSVDSEANNDVADSHGTNINLLNMANGDIKPQDVYKIFKDERNEEKNKKNEKMEKIEKTEKKDVEKEKQKILSDNEEEDLDFDIDQIEKDQTKERNKSNVKSEAFKSHLYVSKKESGINLAENFNIFDETKMIKENDSDDSNSDDNNYSINNSHNNDYSNEEEKNKDENIESNSSKENKNAQKEEKAEDKSVSPFNGKENKNNENGIYSNGGLRICIPIDENLDDLDIKESNNNNQIKPSKINKNSNKNEFKNTNNDKFLEKKRKENHYHQNPIRKNSLTSKSDHSNNIDYKNYLSKIDKKKVIIDDEEDEEFSHKVPNYNKKDLNNIIRKNSLNSRSEHSNNIDNKNYLGKIDKKKVVIDDEEDEVFNHKVSNYNKKDLLLSSPKINDESKNNTDIKETIIRNEGNKFTLVVGNDTKIINNKKSSSMKNIKSLKYNGSSKKDFKSSKNINSNNNSENKNKINKNKNGSQNESNKNNKDNNNYDEACIKIIQEILNEIKRKVSNENSEKTAIEKCFDKIDDVRQQNDYLRRKKRTFLNIIKILQILFSNFGGNKCENYMKEICQILECVYNFFKNVKKYDTDINSNQFFYKRKLAFKYVFSQIELKNYNISSLDELISKKNNNDNNNNNSDNIIKFIKTYKRYVRTSKMLLKDIKNVRENINSSPKINATTNFEKKYESCPANIQMSPHLMTYKGLFNHSSIVLSFYSDYNEYQKEMKNLEEPKKIESSKDKNSETKKKAKSIQINRNGYYDKFKEKDKSVNKDREREKYKEKNKNK